MPRSSEIATSARALISERRLAAAVALIDEALAQRPTDADLIGLRGEVLFEWERNHEARQAFVKAFELGARDPSLLLKVGWNSLALGDRSAAETWMRTAVARDATDWNLRFALGVVLQSSGRMPEAIAAFRQASAMAPTTIEPLLHLASCALAQDAPTAKAMARRVIELNDQSAGAWTILAMALDSQDRFGEARQAFGTAHKLETDANLNLAMCLRDAGQLREAFDLYERHLPDMAGVGANTHYAHALLTAGRLPEGWIQYEFRWLQEPLLSRRPSFRKPVWDGQDLRGKTILLRAEQGLGDAIQFIRYAPHVRALGATVLFEPRPGLGDLVRAFPAIDQVIDPARPYPPFDYCIHLMSLPRVFAIDLATIPAAVPYLHVDSERSERWASRLRSDTRFKVALAWAGDRAHLRDRHRSIPLASLASLAEDPRIALYSLQKGPVSNDAAKVRAEMKIEDLAPDLHDLADTMAAIEQMDLVVCVDTAVAHLAGAIGKNVWVMLPEPPDWRWMRDRTDSPWYPTMRLFRQATRGDWTDVIERVRRALDDHVDTWRGDESGGESALLGETVLEPQIDPIDSPQHALPRLTGVAETAVGIVQFTPDPPEVATSIAWYGEWLPSRASLVTRMTRPGAVIVEVNPGIGLEVLAIASAVGANGHFILCESRSLYKDVLRNNLAANGIGNATIIGRPILDAHASADVANAGQETGHPAHASATPGDTIDAMRFEAVDWLKIHAPADPIAILKGASETLWRQRPILLVDARGTEDAAGIAASARDFAYQCWRIETPFFDPGNFNGRNIDLFAGRFATTILAVPEEIHADATLVGHAKLTP